LPAGWHPALVPEHIRGHVDVSNQVLRFASTRGAQIE
jgi:hypothetical protein